MTRAQLEALPAETKAEIVRQFRIATLARARQWDASYKIEEALGEEIDPDYTELAVSINDSTKDDAADFITEAAVFEALEE